MVRPYPGEWRERYAGEMPALLAQIRASPRTAPDLALGQMFVYSLAGLHQSIYKLAESLAKAQLRRLQPRRNY